MRMPTAILAAALLAPCAPCPALAAVDMQSTVVRYSVSATVTFVDDDVRLIQKAPVGTLIKAPDLGEHAGYIFLGWMSQQTGELWDFDDPVPGDLVLVASYRQAEPSQDEEPPADTSKPGEPTDSAPVASAVPKTADGTPSPLLPATLAVPALAGSAVLLKVRSRAR